MDGAYMEESPEFKPALRVISQVMSCPNDTRITSDAGLKSISVDSGMPLPIEKNVDLEKLSEEHATMSVKNNAMFELGSRISLLPMHGDTTINRNMKFLVKTFYNILLNCENFNEKSLNTKKVFFFKYLTHNGMKKKADNTLLIEYFTKYQAFCFDLSFDSILKGKLNFKYK